MRELLERVLDEGMTSRTFPAIERPKAVAFVFDSAYRFIHPVAIRLDRNAPPQNLSQRREVILSTLVRSLLNLRPGSGL